MDQGKQDFTEQAKKLKEMGTGSYKKPQRLIWLAQANGKKTWRSLLLELKQFETDDYKLEKQQGEELCEASRDAKGWDQRGSETAQRAQEGARS